MKILSSSDEDIALAAAALAAGKLVAFPTETVYGLGGDAFNPQALARIFEAKNRPRFDPLIIHIAGRDALGKIADTGALDSEGRERLALLSARLWPGPLTLVLPKKREVPDLATSGLPTAAVRFPDHQTAQKLIFLSTGAVAAPSANPFGYLSPTRAEHVREQLGDKTDFIIEGGRTKVGLESTVLDISSSQPQLLRPGGCSLERIEEVIGRVAVSSPLSPGSAGPSSPGQLKSHYAPRTPLVLYAPGRLVSLPRKDREGFLFFDRSSCGAWLAAGKAGDGGKVFFLSETGKAAEAAANLFDILHTMDELGLSLIRAEEAPPGGLGAAINDRLRRAEAAGGTAVN
ncbi:MAG: threonylcarbamoyl-AMP synthase [Treponema sp.]|nr:threonylcarbamoyl-AMP synthase [Treponema sp.]